MILSQLQVLIVADGYSPDMLPIYIVGGALKV